jgi:hypothetical protein
LAQSESKKLPDPQITELGLSLFVAPKMGGGICPLFEKNAVLNFFKKELYCYKFQEISFHTIHHLEGNFILWEIK